MAHGEFWIAKEIYRRELMNIKVKNTGTIQDEKLKIIIEWLESKIRELDELTVGKKS